MTRPYQTQGWLKLLLSAGLVLILAQGLVSLPELGSSLFPQWFWDGKILHLRADLEKAESAANNARAQVEALLRLRESEKTRIDGNPRPTPPGLEQALNRAEAEARRQQELVVQLTILCQRWQRQRARALARRSDLGLWGSVKWAFLGE
jgi:hypothetical protein